MFWSKKARQARRDEEKRLLAECERMAEELGAIAAPNGRRVNPWVGYDHIFEVLMPSADGKPGHTRISESSGSPLYTRISALKSMQERLEFECAGLPSRRGK